MNEFQFLSSLSKCLCPVCGSPPILESLFDPNRRCYRYHIRCRDKGHVSLAMDLSLLKVASSQGDILDHFRERLLAVWKAGIPSEK